MKQTIISLFVLATLAGTANAGYPDAEIRVDRDGNRIDFSPDRWSVTVPKETGEGDKKISTETRVNRRWGEKRIEFDLKGFGTNLSIGKRIK